MTTKKTDSPAPPADAAQLEQDLQALLGHSPALPEPRLRRIRAAVFERLARPATGLPAWLRWHTALPAAAVVLLLGGALGWSLEGSTVEQQELGLFSPSLGLGAGELQ